MALLNGRGLPALIQKNLMNVYTYGGIAVVVLVVYHLLSDGDFSFLMVRCAPRCLAVLCERWGRGAAGRWGHRGCVVHVDRTRNSADVVSACCEFHAQPSARHRHSGASSACARFCCC